MRLLTYLATPYRSDDPAVIEARFQQVNKAAGVLLRDGFNVYSPISHSHPIAMACELPGDWKFWERIDREYLSLSKRLVVLMLDGWKESEGVQAEIAIATEMGIPIDYLEP